MKRIYLKPEAEIIKIDCHAPLLEESTPGGDDNFGKENDWDDDDDFNGGETWDDLWKRHMRHQQKDEEE